MSASRTMFITSFGGSAQTGHEVMTASAQATAGIFICSSLENVLWRGMALDVEHHRHQRVVARHADQVDNATLAKPLEYRFVCGVAHKLLLVQLGAEVVDGSLVVFHGRRAAPLREIRRDPWCKTCLQRERVMRVRRCASFSSPTDSGLNRGPSCANAVVPRQTSAAGNAPRYAFMSPLPAQYLPRS